MYATLNSAVYYLQMTVVVPAMLNDQTDKVAFFTLNDGPVIYGLEVFGYTQMSLATLLAAPIIVREGRLE